MFVPSPFERRDLEALRGLGLHNAKRVVSAKSDAIFTLHLRVFDRDQCYRADGIPGSLFRNRGAVLTGGESAHSPTTRAVEWKKPRADRFQK